MSGYSVPVDVPCFLEDITNGTPKSKISTLYRESLNRETVKSMSAL